MTVKQINEIIEEVSSLKILTQAYGEIAIAKISKIRSEVEKNRSFFREISEVYRMVKLHAAAKRITLLKPKKTISILLASNYRFYGNIDNQVTRHFIETTPHFPTDRIVVGKTANNYLRTMQYFNPYKTVELKSDLPETLELNYLSGLIKDYNQILVFYPQFVSLLVQKPVMVDITQSQLQINQNDKTADFAIFEPEIEKIVEFFDSQINILLLQQSFFEAELSRTAARILSMDQAQVEANRYIDQQKQLIAKYQKGIINIRILEIFASLKTVKKEIL